MKRPSSGLGVGLWVVGSLTGIYVLGGVIFFGTKMPHEFPGSVINFCYAIYRPVMPLLEYAGIISR